MTIQRKSTPHGLGQLSLVEHALCPLDATESLANSSSNTYEYFYSDGNQRRIANVQIHAPAGLTAGDEFYLWGLLALTMSQDEPTLDFYATPHFCLRELGLISTKTKGGKRYALFREAIRRLAAIRYQNDGFYDPNLGEHRSVSFGLFGYSLPVDPKSSRAWRFVWDLQFFELCRAAGSIMSFDLNTYRELDHASRRLFLLLQKVFWRRTTSPRFDLRQLAVNVLGFSPSLETKHLKAKVTRCATVLQQRGIITLDKSATGQLFAKRTKGVYSVQFMRGPYFDRTSNTTRPMTTNDSPMTDPLKSIGFDDRDIHGILRRFSVPQIQLWCDVTLAAIEHKGQSFFRRSPQAFFMNNLQRAAEGLRTPPDWFLELRKREERRTVFAAREKTKRHSATKPAKPMVPSRAIDKPADLNETISAMTHQFLAAGQTEEQARRNAQRFASTAFATKPQSNKS